MITTLFIVAGGVVLALVLHGFASGLGECLSNDARHRYGPSV